MTTIIKIGFFLLSNAGYWEFFRNKPGIRLHYLPFFTIAVQFTILFFAGLLNILLEVSVVLYFLGFIFLLQSILRNKLHFVRPYLNAGYFFLAAVCLLAAVVLKDLVIADPDSIHHWSVITNTMLRTNRFPNFQDTIITFKSYPLGSSTFIYYFCRFTSIHEDIQLVAQVYMLVCMFLPVFSHAKSTPIISTILATLVLNFLLCYNTNIRDLRVDTLLPLCGTAIWLFIYETYYHPDVNSTPVPVFCCIPLFFLCTQIKNSGIFFCLIAVIMLYASQPIRGQMRNVTIICLSPLAALYLWNRHYTSVFPDGSMAKHSMSAEWYHYVLSEKSTSDMIGTIQKVIQFAFKRRELVWLILWVALLLLIVHVARKKDRKSCLRFTACLVCIYVFYMAGICGMYLLSMPKNEAANLGDFSRYAKSIDISIYYLLTFYSILLLGKLEQKHLRAATGVLLLLFTTVCWRSSFGRFTAVWNNTAEYEQNLVRRMEYQQLLEDYGVQEGYQYLVLEKPDIYEDSYFYIKYLTNTGEVYAMDVTDVSQLEIAKDYQYIFVFDRENKIVNQWLQENFPPEKANETVIYNF